MTDRRNLPPSRDEIDLDESQIAEIQAALKEADVGDFASEQEVEALRRKWRGR